MMAQCPQCNSTNIMAPLKPVTPTPIRVNITEPRTSGLQFRAVESAELRLAICGECGHAEHYIDDAPRLWKYWQKGYR